jgi:hypothetical protein
MTTDDIGTHASPDLLARYAAGDDTIPPDALWAVEAHLETCGGCREQLVGAPAVTALVDRVRLDLDAGIARSPRRPARRRLAGRTIRWVIPTVLRYAAMTAAITAVAVGFDLVSRLLGGQVPSLVLLFAPVAPLLGVGAVWARGADPAYEIVAATPRAGLYLVLRRTLAVLLFVLPMLTVAGLAVGASPARWLLPALAFTVGAIALGEVIGVARAATGLALLWAAAVVTPSLLTAEPPVVLEPESRPGWVAVTAVVAAVLVIRRHAFNRLPIA